MVQQSQKYRSGCIVEKTTTQKARNNANCHPPMVRSHEHGFRILKCLGVSLWVRWAPRPPPHSPKTPRNHDFLFIELSTIRGAYFQKMIAASVLIGEQLFNKTLERNSSNKALEKKQASGLARSQHSWHGGGAAGGYWIKCKSITRNLKVLKYIRWHSKVPPLFHGNF